MTLMWHSLVNQTVKKVLSNLAILKRTKALVKRDTIINIYSALTVPYFDYCIPVLGYTGKYQCEKLQISQIGLPA